MAPVLPLSQKSSLQLLSINSFLPPRFSTALKLILATTQPHMLVWAGRAYPQLPRLCTSQSFHLHKLGCFHLGSQAFHSASTATPSSAEKANKQFLPYTSCSYYCYRLDQPEGAAGAAPWKECFSIAKNKTLQYGILKALKH